MATTKVSALTAKTTPSGSEELLINDGGVSKKITIANLPDNDTVYTHPNHSGDVTSTADGATVISAGAVDIAMLSATGTAGATNFLRGDNTWVVPTDTNTTYTSSDFTHDDLTGFVANEHIDWTTDQGATNINNGNLTGSPTFTTLNATTVDLGNWTVTETAGVLIFASSGTNKAKLDASGNFTCVGDVISNGTI